jgi:hypothetical protein
VGAHKGQSSCTRICRYSAAHTLNLQLSCGTQKRWCPGDVRAMRMASGHTPALGNLSIVAHHTSPMCQKFPVGGVSRSSRDDLEFGITNFDQAAHDGVGTPWWAEASVYRGTCHKRQCENGYSGGTVSCCPLCNAQSLLHTSRLPTRQIHALQGSTLPPHLPIPRLLSLTPIDVTHSYSHIILSTSYTLREKRREYYPKGN